MAENENAEGAAQAGNGAAQQVQPKMQIQGQFIRDLSFENILSQNRIEGNVTPDIQVQVSLDGKKREEENQYEVTSKYKITSKARDGGQTLFLLELEYGGLFKIEGVPQEQLHPYLMIECPRMLFPFVRRIVADVTRDGGFPPLSLDNIDFVQLYRQQLQQRKAQREAAESQNPVS